MILEVDSPLSSKKTRQTTLAGLCSVFLFLALLAGCAQAPDQERPVTTGYKKPGYTTHKIRHGETVWAISKKYNVSAQTIIELNGIKDVTDIEVGTEILIPHTDYSPVTKTASLSTSTSTSTSTGSTSSVSSKGFIWPAKGMVTHRYGDIVAGRRNTGVDIEAQAGQDVLAAKGGMVEVVTDNPDGWGKVVVLRHNGGIHTWYAHNSEVLVHKGNWVRRGQVIAKVGQSGSTTRPELHFKVFRNDKPVNPLPYLPQ